jgi:tetratricopeptide (TPR) repeat protein/predicted Ser/Thr protein kinase
MVGTTVSHYRILDKLGEGGMGVVYSAEDLTLGRMVALKFCSSARVSPGLRGRLLEEARAASSLSHPNIAQVYEFGESGDGEPFIAMELVAGRSLSDLVRNGPLAVEEAVRIASGVARALGEAHRRGIVHRDIKPANIRVTGSGEVKVLDFGLAKPVSVPAAAAQASEAATRTLEGVTRGTPLYMSPEQVSGGTVDRPSDLFSLGAVFYECLTGRSPFSGETVAEVLRKVLAADPPPPSSLNAAVPASLDRVTLRLLAKDPRERYSTAEELAEDLAGRVASGRSPRRPRRPARALTRRGAVVLIAAGAMASGGLFFGLRRARPGDAPAPAAETWYRKGLASLSDGAFLSATKAFTRALAIDGAYVMAHAHLAEAWWELDYSDRARDEMLRALPPGRSLSSLPLADALHFEAIRATVTGDYKAAATAYQKLADDSQGHDRVDALLDRGRACERDQQARKAGEAYTEATRLDPDCAAAWLRLGSLKHRLRDLAGAGAALDKAESLYQSASNLEGANECRYERIRQTTDPARKRDLLAEALRAAAVTGNHQQQVKLLLFSSGDYAREGQAAKAMEDASRAVEAARRAGIENLANAALIDVGNALFVRGDIGGAEKVLTEALDIARNNREHRAEARALVNRGGVRIQAGNTADGWKDVNDGLAFYRGGGYHSEAAMALILLARAMRKKGDYEGARRAFAESYRTVAGDGPSAQLALSAEGLASVLAEQQRFPEALEQYRASREVYRAMGNPLGAGYTTANAGVVLARLGRDREALAELRAAAALAASSDAKGLDELTRGYQATADLLQGRYGPAHAAAGRLVAALPEGDGESRLAWTLVDGLALARSGRRAEALAACRAAEGLASRLESASLEAEALLALAEASLAAGDRAAVPALVERARPFLERAGKRESLWRAWALVARAESGERARDASRQAAAALAALQNGWTAADAAAYTSRADVRSLGGERIPLQALKFNSKSQ